MIYLDLLIGFFKVGCFSFGGAYGAIPLIRDIVLAYGWLTDEELTYMIAVSESTPGSIMVNIATYVGSAKAGLPGSLLATFAVVLPAFLIILLLTAVLKKTMNNKYVQALLDGLKPCIIGIILAVGIYMVIEHCAANGAADIRALLISAILGALMLLLPKLTGKKLSPIMLILISAVMGAVVYSI